MESDARHIRGFNGLRAIAVALVFIAHKLGLGQVDIGRVGLWLFFVLSGYLIVGILHRERIGCESGRTSPGPAIKRFFFRRTLRIFPIYYLLLAACALVLAYAHYTANQSIAALFIGGATGLIYRAFYLSNFLVGVKLHHWVGLLDHLWSLSIEEQFYIVMAPLVLLMPSRHHMKLCIGVFVIGVVSIFLLRGFKVDETFTYTFTLCNFAIIVSGAMGRLASTWLKPHLSGRALPMALACAVIVLTLDRDLIVGPASAPVIQAVIDLAIIAGCATVVIWIASNQFSRITGWLEWRPLEYVGRISYGVYLYHMFVPDFGSGGKLAAKFGLPITPLTVVVGLLVCFAMTVGVAHLSWRYIEQPILRLKDRRIGLEIGGRTGGATPPATTTTIVES
ncbi:acyltransferase [Paraburkholderia xenovorans]|uniref:acyltransferase family protein n=1 Tax=Paraburkholderia xenovorans TaxID=36873 RepID=UPI0038B7FB39